MFFHWNRSIVVLHIKGIISWYSFESSAQHNVYKIHPCCSNSIIYLSISLLVDIWVVSSFGAIINIVPMSTPEQVFFSRHMFSFLLEKYQGGITE